MRQAQEAATRRAFSHPKRPRGGCARARSGRLCNQLYRTAPYGAAPVSPPYTVRFDEFKTQPLNKYASLAIEDRYEASKAWQKELETSAGLTWERKPHEADERRSSAGRGPQSPELPDDDDL